MPERMDDKTQKEVTGVLQRLPNTVSLIFFTAKKDCETCPHQQHILETLTGFSDKLKLEIYDFGKEKKRAHTYGIDKVPATAVRGKKDYGMRFFGVTAGHEFSSLLQAIVMAGTEQSGLHPDLEELVKKINIPVHLEVMTTLACPYCPQAVHAAQQLAMVNDTIQADMVDSAEFPALAKQYSVYETPKTVINGVHSFIGAQPAQAVYLEVLKAVDPDEYDRTEMMIREARGHRHVRKADVQQLYDTIIIGGGPAALSAAVYAARKEMNVLLVTKAIGGQITYTANVDNYLGLPHISGREMKDQFTFHMEQYPVAESVGENVAQVMQKQGTFIVTTEGGKEFTGRTVIYCAGKEYRRLGVPHEEKFIGHGIAFCATCDAPLYKNKKVAVIGGANSAFTAARDLITFASKIYLVHRRDTFKADATLVQQVREAKNVTFHTNMIVQEFLGNDTLTGVRLRSTTSPATKDLSIDGAFLEIGLSANTDPIKDFIELNEKGEIPVQPDNATSRSGFFAAGDVTDVPEKQIVVAAGEGAKAALSAYKYLVDKKLITIQTTDTWE
ncbi:hypothetical protein AMJ87_11025 [candidate division WOR_3 bacterium SM23_60]|uniref:Thioredoxin reductase n=1 Tax=candidate division WOR_3 bacterium SM23_60 TaxID=1703780 RepID=A0A0S8G8Z7_UNCW3|nr:MAG: hypothetical protein AMJ87_11025 [candidate division WOR_3 bacterium SM23_60]